VTRLQAAVTAAQTAFDTENAKKVTPNQNAAHNAVLTTLARALEAARLALDNYQRYGSASGREVLGPPSPRREAGAVDRGPQTSDTPILWAEGRDTEAYIPYDRQYRDRAIGLLSQVASDFGLAVLPKMGGHRPQRAGGLIPHYAMGMITDQVQRAAMGTLTAASAARYPSSSPVSRSVAHNETFAINVETVDHPTGEQLGRDIAWGLTTARGRSMTRADR
jgi:hypothetical protein